MRTTQSAYKHFLSVQRSFPGMSFKQFLREVRAKGFFWKGNI